MEKKLIDDIKKTLIVGLYTYKNDAYGVEPDVLLENATKEYFGHCDSPKTWQEKVKCEFNFFHTTIESMTANIICLIEGGDYGNKGISKHERDNEGGT